MGYFIRSLTEGTPVLINQLFSLEGLLKRLKPAVLNTVISHERLK